jgi:para-nitrobenzyl esterase
LAKTISAYWAAFGKNGNPDGAGRPAWPLFSGERGKIIDFTNDGPQVTDVPRVAALDAVAAAYPQQE